MKYGLLTYKTANLGDEIQSLAAKKFLPRVDAFLDRDNLNMVKYGEKIKVIMNGWFTLKNGKWLPSADIKPLFISFHISEQSEGLLFSKTQFLEYLKEHQPIGCRDYYTVTLLQKNGVEAYFSGCLTLTLENCANERPKEILLVDLSKEVIKALPKQIFNNASKLSHWGYSPRIKKIRIFMNNNVEAIINIIRTVKLDFLASKILQLFAVMNKLEKLNEAEVLLKKYSEASLVVTSRLHCALPCVALGTPVIFIPPNPNDVRFKGYQDFLKIYSLYDIETIDWNSIPKTQVPTNLRENLIQKVHAFIKEDV